MFERFTDRARRVVVLAQEESRLLGHSYIGTEHILLGLLHEGEGVAAQVLMSVDVSLDAARTRVAEIVGHKRGAPVGHIPFTPHAKAVLETSLREALALHHSYIGTEHILLGLTRETDGVAARVLAELGADLDTVRERVIEAVGRGDADREESAASHAPTPIQRFAEPEATGVRPARCGFCDGPSTEVGALFTGSSGALICRRCAFGVLQFSAQSGRTALGNLPREVPGSLDELAARHVVTGPPPHDEDAARRAIEYAFTDPMETSADGRVLVNVEDGEALAPLAAEVLRRTGPFIAARENVVEHIMFLDDVHAVVWTTVRLRDGTPLPVTLYQEGRAVLVDGRWKVARDTICERWGQAGVRCPPRTSQ